MCSTIHRYGPNPWMWAVVSMLSIIPIIVGIPILMSNTQVYYNVWIWVIVAQFVFFMVLSVAMVARARRFVTRLECAVQEGARCPRTGVQSG